KTRVWEYLSWLAVFTYFLADDAFQLHENIGRSIAGNLDFAAPFNLRLPDIGELTVLAVAGMILLVMLSCADRRETQACTNVAKDLWRRVGSMTRFGAFIDAAEIAVTLGLFIKETLGLIDDGEEMIVVSVMLWYVFRLAIHNWQT